MEVVIEFRLFVVFKNLCVSIMDICFWWTVWNLADHLYNTAKSNVNLHGMYSIGKGCAFILAGNILYITFRCLFKYEFKKLYRSVANEVLPTVLIKTKEKYEKNKLSFNCIINVFLPIPVYFLGIGFMLEWRGLFAAYYYSVDTLYERYDISICITCTAYIIIAGTTLSVTQTTNAINFFPTHKIYKKDKSENMDGLFNVYMFQCLKPKKDRRVNEVQKFQPFLYSFDFCEFITNLVCRCCVNSNCNCGCFQNKNERKDQRKDSSFTVMLNNNLTKENNIAVVMDYNSNKDGGVAIITNNNTTSDKEKHHFIPCNNNTEILYPQNDSIATVFELTSKDAVTKETTLSKDAVTTETTLSKDAVTTETTLSKDAVTTETTLSKDAVTTETTLSKDAVTTETTLSKDAVTTETTLSKDAVTKETTLSKDAVTKETTLSKDAVTTETTLSKDAVTTETTLSKDAVTTETTLSKDAVTTETTLSKDAVTKETTLSKDAVTTETTLSKDAVTTETTLSKDAVTKETTLSKDAVTTETTLSKDAVTTETTLSKDAVTTETTLSKDAVTTETTLSKDAVTTETTLSKDAVTTETTLSKDAVTTETTLSKDAVTTETTLSKDAVTTETTLSKDAVTTETTLSKDAVTTETTLSKDAVTTETTLSKDAVTTETTLSKDAVTTETTLSKDAVTTETTEIKQNSRHFILEVIQYILTIFLRHYILQTFGAMLWSSIWRMFDIVSVYYQTGTTSDLIPYFIISITSHCLIHFVLFRMKENTNSTVVKTILETLCAIFTSFLWASIWYSWDIFAQITGILPPYFLIGLSQGTP